MSDAKLQALLFKISYVATLLLGVAFTTYNLFSFKISKGAYYFLDTNQTWLAVGVTILTISYVIKNWKKI
ncbi:MAG: hypothetical protein KAJ39_02355 [Gammaproteobacteria bacterium]|nr:hypothetical protein [Gammaproteobacteria bacterium]